MKRRTALVLVVAGLALVAGTLLVSRRVASNNDSVVDPGFARGAYPIIVPDLCHAAAELRAGRRTDAYNSFYRRAHPALHALAADVASRGNSGRAESGKLRRAKSKVEAGLPINSHSLEGDLQELIEIAGSSLTLIHADKDMAAPISCG